MDIKWVCIYLVGVGSCFGVLYTCNSCVNKIEGYAKNNTKHVQDTVSVFEILKTPPYPGYPEVWHITSFDKNKVKQADTFTLYNDEVTKIGDIKQGDTIVIDRKFIKGRHIMCDSFIKENLSRQRRMNEFINQKHR